MEFPDKYGLTADQNRRFARQNFDRLVHTNARFEGVNTTLPQTKTIMAGMSVAGVSVEDTLTIVNLKRGWELVTNASHAISIDLEKKINAVVAAQGALVPGEFKTGAGAVDIGEETFEPALVKPDDEAAFLDHLLNSDKSTTDKALTLLYHNMRGQLFWDGNKRTAMLAANKIMIDGGAGLINVPLNHWERWNDLISAYYRTGDMRDVKTWTYEHGIQGVSL